VKIEILESTPDPQKLIERAARTCYKSEGKITEDSHKNFIRKLITAGHLSVLEHASVTFRLEGVSRALTHQLVRHRLCSFSQQSQRYVGEDNFNYIIPEKIRADREALCKYEECMAKIKETYIELTEKGVPKEDARYVLPNSCLTEIVFTGNFRELRHMLELRGSLKAQWEIREVFIEILRQMKEIAPDCFFDFKIDESKRKIIKESK